MILCVFPSKIAIEFAPIKHQLQILIFAGWVRASVLNGDHVALSAPAAALIFTTCVLLLSSNSAMSTDCRASSTAMQKGFPWKSSRASSTRPPDIMLYARTLASTRTFRGGCSMRVRYWSERAEENRDQRGSQRNCGRGKEDMRIPPIVCTNYTPENHSHKWGRTYSLEFSQAVGKTNSRVTIRRGGQGYLWTLNFTRLKS